MKHPTQQGPDIRRLIIAIILATAVMLAWQYFYERPRAVARNAEHIAKLEEKQAKEAQKQQIVPKKEDIATPNVGPRVKINSDAVHGSIALVGGRFDDLTLARYRETSDPESPEVKLLSRTGTEDAYFVEIGMLAGAGVRVPDGNTQWQADGTVLTPQKPVTLTWNNGQGLTFTRKIALDENYMFTVSNTVTNNSGAAATVYPYGLVSRNYDDSDKKHFVFLHEGPLGAINNKIEDVTYKALREDGASKWEGAKGWIGMTDKYWLTALIPPQDGTFDSEFKYFKRGEADAYQADLRGQPMEIAPGQSETFTLQMFAGAKVVQHLDDYSAQYNIPLFDRAVDFGTLYFLTRPIFKLMNYFHGIVGNFGVAILLLTVVIKILLFPLASKSMTSMARTKQLMPKMQEIRERFKSDKMKMNQEIMALYKREKVNPVSGCLPILLQIPVFFALYRVLFVTIEMRQAPFFGWIHDLSMIDPTNVFTLFGLVPWATPSFLHIGIWPIIMCATMVIQQRLSPKPADEVQAAIMNWMPYMFLFLFASFPAGLVIYWAWNNTLTVMQMLYINKRLEKKGLLEKKQKPAKKGAKG